ncbi:hypothetical protein LB452_06665 [Psychroflexus sp. CAK8W]|uniref:Outer membrane protein beta-barrel domain-containing protein n=1 Tax=Psychroflexus longus TaxID=2873596 RepID=A0ABS7XIN2_9FLAO|nr:hypothetical protein [Psychroflexus longus]MBZ9778600.1 hypothetical protein [Psychroflexus longus]
MKYFIFSIVMVFTVSTQAQNLAGAQVSFDSDRDNTGIGFKGVFGLSNSLSFSPDINYFFGSGNFATVNILTYNWAWLKGIILNSMG